MKRSNRLTRSRDFDAVHRRGRSVSSRYLVLYWLPQDEPAEPRIGFAVPRAAGGAVERNRIKRQLREVWDARLDSVAPGFDYVLIVRQGLPEAAEANGFAWLGAQVDELLAKTGAMAALRPPTTAPARPARPFPAGSVEPTPAYSAPRATPGSAWSGPTA